MGKPIRFVVVNEEKVAKELGDKDEAVIAAVNPVIRRAALKVANRMIKLLNSGSRSGRVYPRPGGGTHQASAVGQPPKSDTGFLAAHIKPTATTVKGAVVSSTVVVSANYAGWLEEGTDFMGPRPFVAPSFALEQAGINRDIKRAVKKAIG